MRALPAKAFNPRCYQPGNSGTWSGHLPFVHDLVAALRPRLLVELGTYYGESYFGMCQAVEENGIACACYAVDHWKGDPQTGFYDESVYDDVARHNQRHYASFSTLLRTEFDDAAANFADDSIDLLHIDGLHSYETVRHDFDTWFPKVRPGGVVLLHDTAVRQNGFEVWRLWGELADRHPHLEFLHSYGLGVLCKAGGRPAANPELEALFPASGEEETFLRHYYVLQAELLHHRKRVEGQTGSKSVVFQIFPFLSDRYTEEASARTEVEPGGWRRLVLELPQGAGTGPIRVDPADRPCIVEFAGILLQTAADRVTVRAWTDETSLRALVPISQAVALQGPGVRFLSTGDDPQVHLPLEAGSGDQPLVLVAHVRVHDDLAAVGELLQAVEPSTPFTREAMVNAAIAERDRALARVHELGAEIQTLRAERIAADTESRDAMVSAATAERDLALARGHDLAAEIKSLQAERLAAAADYRRVHSENEALVSETTSLRTLLDEATARCERLQDSAERRAQLEDELKGAHQQLRTLYGSNSWRLTAPLRWLRHFGR
jgi:hypothetical protein